MLTQDQADNLIAANAVMASALQLAFAELSSTRGAAVELIDAAREHGWDEKIAERRVAELDEILRTVSKGIDLARQFMASTP